MPISNVERYDRPARAYDERLAAASLGEEELAEDLWKRGQQATEEQLAQQTALAQRDIAGAGAGGAPERLRSATYAQGQVTGQSAADAAMMKAMQEQAYREQMMGVLGRRGEYGMQTMGFGAEQYAAAQQQEAYERQQEELRKAQEAQAAAEWVGMLTGAAGAGIGGAF